MTSPITDFDELRSATNRNHTRQEAHKHRASVAPRTTDFYNQDVRSCGFKCNALSTELRDRSDIFQNIPDIVTNFFWSSPRIACTHRGQKCVEVL